MTESGSPALSVRELLTKRWSQPTTPFINREISTATTTAQIALKQNPNRPAFIIVNTGSKDIYLLNDNTVSATKGIPIIASGGSLQMDMIEDFDLPTQEWWIKAASLTSTVLIVEQEFVPSGVHGVKSGEITGTP